jgi:hypothetical protein
MNRKHFLSSLLLIPAAVIAGIGTKKPDRVSAAPSIDIDPLTKTTMVGQNCNVSVDFNANHLGKTVTVMTLWESGKPYSTCWTEDKYGPDNCYVAWHPELTGCMAQGWTVQEALRSLDDARELYLSPSPSGFAVTYTEVSDMDAKGDTFMRYRVGEKSKHPAQYVARVLPIG